jgi:hypothetical protein
MKRQECGDFDVIDDSAISQLSPRARQHSPSLDPDALAKEFVARARTTIVRPLCGTLRAVNYLVLAGLLGIAIPALVYAFGGGFGPASFVAMAISVVAGATSFVGLVALAVRNVNLLKDVKIARERLFTFKIAYAWDNACAQFERLDPAEGQNVDGIADMRALQRGNQALDRYLLTRRQGMMRNARDYRYVSLGAAVFAVIGCWTAFIFRLAYGQHLMLTDLMPLIAAPLLFLMSFSAQRGLMDRVEALLTPPKRMLERTDPFPRFERGYGRVVRLWGESLPASALSSVVRRTTRAG